MRGVRRIVAAVAVVSGVVVTGTLLVELSRRSGRARISGELERGEKFSQRFGPGFRFCLDPGEHGWTVRVSWGEDDRNLAWITPPLHGGMNHRYIEGWHFRNADNTGPNEPGPGNVNAPGLVREFTFLLPGQPSPERRQLPEYLSEPHRLGSGKILLSGLRLGRLVPGKRAVIESLRFEAVLRWPANLRSSDR